MSHEIYYEFIDEVILKINRKQENKIIYIACVAALEVGGWGRVVARWLLAVEDHDVIVCLN